jgi:tetratricopeptide (TPR) repeat protein
MKAAASCFRAQLLAVRSTGLILGALAAVCFHVLAHPSMGARAQASKTASEAHAHLDAARLALQSHDLHQTREQLELALQADPKLAEAYIVLGTVEFQSGDNASAIRHLQHAVELQPASFSAHYNLALVYLRAQKLNEGTRELERASALDPRNADAAYNLGVVLLEQGHPQEAIRHLRRAQELGSDRPDVAFHLIRAQLAANRVEEADREARTAAQSFGGDADWLAAVGHAFLEHDRPREAALYLQEALRLRPDLTEVRRQLAEARIEEQDADGALAAMQADPQQQSPKEVRGERSVEDHYLLASAYFMLRRLPEAEAESRAALTQPSPQPRYLLLAAKVNQRLGKQEPALELLKRAIKLTPEWAELYYSAGVSYYMLRRYADARQSLSHTIQLDSRSARALFLYAATLVNEGKNSEAEEYLRRAIALEPTNARFQYHLGSLLLRANRAAQARQAFETAIQLKPDYGAPHYQLGKLLARSGTPASAQLAVRELETAVLDQHDLSEAYYQLSRLYARLGEREKSQSALALFNELKKKEGGEPDDMTDEIRQDLQRQ